MKRILAVAAVFAACIPSVAEPAMVPRLAEQQAATGSNPSACTNSSTGLRSTLPALHVREGDSITVAVTGNKFKPTPTPTPTPNPNDAAGGAKGPALLVVNGGIVELHARTAKNGKIDINLPPGLNGALTIYGTPAPPQSGKNGATPAPTPTPTPTPAPASTITGGGPTGVLTASIRDTYVASIPTQAPATTSDGTNETAVTYTVKGEHSGKTSLRVTDGSDCIAIAVYVKPPANRFTLTTGLAYSSVPHTTFTTVTVPTPVPSASPLPGPMITPGTYVYQTENAQTQSSIPFIGSYRLTDSPTGVNYYASIGFFAKSQSGPLYGLSAGYREVLLTYGWHSQTLDTLCPNVDSSGLVLTRPGGVPAPIGAGFPTTCSSHITKPFWSLTVPLSTFTNLLDKLK